jgi:hypothetical protein
MALRAPARRQRGHAAPYRLRQLQRAPIKDDLAGSHARHVDEIVDETGEMGVLAGDDLAGAARRLLRHPGVVEDVGGGGDGGQGIAQLVPEHGEQLVFAPAGGLGLRAGGVLGRE